MNLRHFLTLRDITSDEFRRLIQRAVKLKAMQKAGQPHTPLLHKTLGMVFEKSSTRTRISFEAGMAQLGGHAIFLSPRDTQLGRGELIEDTAKVLSRMVDIIMVRTFEHEKLLRFAEHSQAPVINALTDQYHPCQLLADMQTFFEHRGDIKGKTVAWIGDGNNMCHSYINAADLLDFQLNIAAPAGYLPEPDVVNQSKDHIRLCATPAEAVVNADLVVTDVWSSMGQEEEALQRIAAFRDYCVTPSLMAKANSDALFMHCLPAHRGEEVEAQVIDGHQSVVWDEAENRLHSQKALLEMLLA